MRETPEFAEYSREILELFLARGVLREHGAEPSRKGVAR
jgi:NitT/TauT family transport system ATP-binding protein